MPLVRVTAPASEPVSLVEVYAHLRLSAEDQEAAPLAPAAALANSGGGNVDNGSHQYAVTFVTPYGETEGGVPSAVVTVSDNTANGKVALSTIPAGGAGVVARRIYRTKAGADAYLLLTTLNGNVATTYTDSAADSSLGVAMPTANASGREDALIGLLIGAARAHAEGITRRAFVSQQWKLVLDQFPMPGMNISSANWYGPQWGNTPGPLSVARPDGKTGFEIYLPLSPLQQVDSIKYIDGDGVQRTLTPDQYIVDPYSEPARITPAVNTAWPATRNQVNAVEVTFTCGYGAPAAVPKGIKSWMLMRIGALYENREEVAVGARIVVLELPFVDRLLDPYRILEY